MEFERDVERYLVDSIESRGGLCWKFTSPGRQGVPDRWCTLSGVDFFVELKCKNGRLAKVQQYQIDQMQRRGVRVFIAWSKADVDKLIGVVTLPGGRTRDDL